MQTASKPARSRIKRLLCCVVVAGCAEHPPAVIEDRSSVAEKTAPEVTRATQISMSDRGDLPVGPDYIVQPGDTLYAIAFRLGMDYRALAALNDIEAPHMILVGQSLATVAPDVTAASVSARAGADGRDTADLKGQGQANKASSTQVAASSGEASAAPSQSAGSASSSAPAATQAAPVVAQLSTRGSGATPEPTPKPKAKPEPVLVANAPVDRWGWPAKGGITRSYAEDVHKGIDLAGARGDPVRASAAGVVVYAGTGVTGYGALIIIKHNDTYLSAYGHNDELLAAEGEQVAAGKLIARMGSSGTDSVKLHFEIRRNGRPINPASLLTSR
jgi:lipoprotein NlpD